MRLIHIQNHFTRTICISVICICLLSACLGQVPTNEPATTQTATPTNTALPTSTSTPRLAELQVVNWRISSFTCDKNGIVENVLVEVTAEGGTLPYAYTVENNPAATKHVPATDTQTTATPAKKGKNATATPIAPTNTPIPTPLTPPTVLPGQLLINVQAGVEITIRSADGQSAIVEVIIPPACSDLSITPIAPIGTPGGSLVPTSSPQPSPTTTQQNLNLPPRPVCSDGLDNDGDGYVDLYDRNCKSKGDQDESH